MDMFTNIFSRKWFLIIAALIIAGGLIGGVYVFSGLPSIDSLPSVLNQPSIRITDRNGRALYEILPEQGGRHAVISPDRIAECMKQATIAVEDKNFYSNPGIDVEGMLRASWINLQGGETIAGGSTITQQVVRSLLLPDERTDRSIRRKLRESVLAWQLSRKYSKEEVLSLYLNQTFYGGFAYGVEAAARTYFAKPASDLRLPECALLAGLPQAPALYNPFDHPEAARKRQAVVLGLMEKNGVINAAQKKEAEDIPLSYNPAPFPIRAPHFVWMVKDEIDQMVQDGRLSADESLVVKTTLDLDAQSTAENAVKRQIAKFKNDHGLDHKVNNAAVLVLDPKKGEILALVGSADYFNASLSGALNMVTAARQPGSAFKPLIYAEAFNPQNQNPWTVGTPILDVETVFPTSGGKNYIPRNYDDKEHGIVSARVALASSLNVPAVITLQKVGLNAMVKLSNRMGIPLSDTTSDFDLSLALGGGQMSLLQLGTAYGALANGGYLPSHTAILSVSNADGRVLYRAENAPQTRIFDPRVTWLISDILNDDHARELGFGLNSTLKIERPAAVKTGTTNNYHDNWTIGYTPSLLVGVWVGNSDYQAMRDVNGLTGAAPIWQETIRGLLRGKAVEEFKQPDGMVRLQVCTFSGMLPTTLCERTSQEWFIEGTQPTVPDTVYKQVWLDKSTGLPAGPQTPIGQQVPVVALDLPVQAQRWAHAAGLRLLSDYKSVSNTAGGLVLTSPQPGAVYSLSGKLDPASQQIPVQVLAGAGLTQVVLYLDGQVLARFTAAPYTTWWQLEPGKHVFSAAAAGSDGLVVRSVNVEITVTR